MREDPFWVWFKERMEIMRQGLEFMDETQRMLRIEASTGPRSSVIFYMPYWEPES